MARRARSVAAAAVPFLVFLGLTLPWIRALPIWDGMFYFDCVLRATQPPFPLSAFSCADHPPGYLFLAGWPQYVLHGSAVALNVANIAWMCVAIAGLLRLLDTLAGDAVSHVEKGLVATVFASAPLVVAVTYHFSADLGLLVFYPWVIDGMLRARHLQTFLAGTALMLAKEPGVALFGVAWLVAALLPEASGILTGGRRWERLRRAAVPLAALVPAALYLLSRHQGGMGLINRDSVLHLGLGPGTGAGYAIMLLLNFTWVLWGIPLVGYALASRLTAAAQGLAFAENERRVGLILLLDTLVLTLVVPVQNPRYFVTAFVPLLLISHALLRRVAPVGPRLAFLGLVIGLNLAANRYTVDPVSIAAFGSAPYGAMRMHCRYWEPDAEGGCGGRDRLVYNQQFLELQAAQNALFRELRPRSDTTFVVGRYATYFMHGPLDAETFEKTRRDDNRVEPRFVTVDELARDDDDPETLYVLHYPRLGFTGLQKLKRRYQVVDEAAYGTARLLIPVTVLRRIKARRAS